MDCLFCKIIAGEIPSYKVYEDDNTFAFLDINPVSQGHTLVIHKQHFSNLEEASEEQLAQTMATVKKIGQSIKDNLGAESYNLVVNNDEAAGQIISHAHFHIIPRERGDGLQPWPQSPYEEGQAEEVVSKFRIL